MGCSPSDGWANPIGMERIMAHLDFIDGVPSLTKATGPVFRRSPEAGRVDAMREMVDPSFAMHWRLPPPSSVCLASAPAVARQITLKGSHGIADGYFAAGTQTLSAEANSTPATSVVRVTDCRPAFLRGVASNVSKY